MRRIAAVALGVIALIALGGALSPRASADTTHTWVGLVDGDWDDPLNWSPPEVPGAGHHVEFGELGVERTINYGAGAGDHPASITFTDSGYTISGSQAIDVGEITSTPAEAGVNTIAAPITRTDSLTLTVNAGSLTVSGEVSNITALTKEGTGTLVLSIANKYTAPTAVLGGVLRVSNPDGLGSPSPASGTTVESGATLELANDITISEPLTLDGGTLRNGSGDNTVMSFGGPDAQSVTVTEAGGTVNVANGTTLTVTALIGGVGGGSPANEHLTKTGPGTLVLGRDGEGAAANDYGGDTTVSDGTLELTKDSLLPAGSDVTVSGATLDLADHSQTVPSLTLTGGTVTTGAGTLTLDGDVTALASVSPATINGNLDLGGDTRTFTVDSGDADPELVVDAVVSTGGVTKAGAGTLILSGDNTYADDTTVTGGMLVAAHDNALGTTAAGTTVEDDATLALDGNEEDLEIEEALTIADGASGTLLNLGGNNTVTGTLVIGDAGTAATISVEEDTSLTIAGAVGGGGTLTKAGDGTLTLSGNNTYTGATTIAEGTLIATSSTALGATAEGTTVVDGATLALDGSEEDLEIAEPLSIAGDGIDGGTAGALHNLGGANTWTVDVSLAGTTISVEEGTSLTITGAIGGDGDLTKAGDGTLTLSGDNAYAGATTIAEGTLVAAHDNALGAATPDPDPGTTVASGATLALDGSITIAEPLTLSGAGVSTTAGALRNLDGNNTVTGTINLAAATTIAIGGEADALTLSGLISGEAANTLTKTGAGTLAFAGTDANDYLGSTVVSQGALTLGKASDTTAVPANLTIGNSSGPAEVRLGADNQIANTAVVTITATGLLDLDGHDDTIGSLEITGGGAVNTAGAAETVGTLTLGGNVTVQAGATAAPATIDGKLHLGGATRTFDVAASDADPELVVDAIVSNGGITKAGGGTMELGGANTYTPARPR